MPYHFCKIAPEELDTMSASHPQGNYQQTSQMGHHRQTRGVHVYYVGARESNEHGPLVAAAQLEIHHNRLSTFAVIHDGPLCDFRNTELTKFFLNKIGAFAKHQGAAQLEITPEVPYQVRDAWGKPLVEQPDAATDLSPAVARDVSACPNTPSIGSITAAGFAHEGFTLGYSAVPRWRFVKDLSNITNERDLLASYTKNTRRDLRIAQESFVTVRSIARDELFIFRDLCELSCEKQGFENHSLTYFESLYDALGSLADVKVAFIDIRAYLASWEHKRDSLKADIEKFERQLAITPHARKIENRLRDAKEKYESALRRIDETRELATENTQYVPAATAFFIWHPRERVYLYSGSDRRVAKLCAPTAIQHRAMLDCLERGITRYNFYGISGVFDDPHDAGRGLLEFKQGFGGYVEELLGTFDYTLKPLVYKTKQLAHKVLGR